MKGTLKSIFSILLFTAALGSHAQLINRTEEKPLTSGIRVGVDLAKYIFQVVEPAITGFEASVDYEVRPNYFIALEGGYEKASPQNENYEYFLDGYYGRVGFDYDLLKNTDDLDILFVGMRYGLSRYTQSAGNIEITNYWGTAIRDIPEERLTTHWAEVVLGMKTELFFAKNIFIGWTARGRFFIDGNDFEVMQPFTIPGYGREEKKLSVGVTWSVFYNIPINR